MGGEIKRGRLAQLCVHLGSHGDGDAAAADPPAFSRGGGEACGQVADAVVGNDGEGSHCHSHFAAGARRDGGLSHLNPVPEPLALASRRKRVESGESARILLGSAHSRTGIMGWTPAQGKWATAKRDRVELTRTEEGKGEFLPGDPHSHPAGHPNRIGGGEEEKQSQQQRWA